MGFYCEEIEQLNAQIVRLISTIRTLRRAVSSLQDFAFDQVDDKHDPEYAPGRESDETAEERTTRRMTVQMERTTCRAIRMGRMTVRMERTTRRAREATKAEDKEEGRRKKEEGRGRGSRTIFFFLFFCFECNGKIPGVRPGFMNGMQISRFLTPVYFPTSCFRMCE
ncbi:hypothetical protein RHGRI_014202 [Rhododendron griersonianum]|nr:hypothetical protein RHGRI_014202 [Rhododendron griersonianum]